MRKIIEKTYDLTGGNNCFACGPDHPFGLHLDFFYDSDIREVSSRFHSNELFAGFPGILHGGIQATILDEIAFWGVWACYKQNGFTYDLAVQYRKKCPTDQLLEAVGNIGDINRRIVSIDVMLRSDDSQTLFTRGTVRYYLPFLKNKCPY
jgi:acyl-coenzyme A thioesterase PaaI-like protein